MRNRRKVSGKQIERCVISTFQIAESMGFKGNFRQSEDLLRIGDGSAVSCPDSRSSSPPISALVCGRSARLHGIDIRDQRA